jgi:pyruvate/2-oxoglutarate dehydrogenase complex dihydrolipoamide dehydrogenase (E3) component
VPPIPGVDQVDFLTNETIMNVESVPPALLILGGSYIGLECAQMVRRFGSKVAVVEAAPQLVPREDDDVSDAICDIPEREGISIHLATKCTGLAQRGATIVAQLEAPTGAVEIEATICCSQSAVGPIPTILASIKLG